MKQQLLSQIQNHNATIAIIGLGYVGLPLAVVFAEAGFPVVGIDVDARKVDTINQGESYVSDIPSARLDPLVRGSQVRATTDFAVLSGCDAAIICAPTPLNKTRDPDVRYLIAAGESVARHMHPGMLVVLESTTYPGTTEELILPTLMGQGDKGTGRQGEGQSPSHPITWSRLLSGIFAGADRSRQQAGHGEKYAQSDGRRYIRLHGGGSNALQVGHWARSIRLFHCSCRENLL